MISMTDVEWWLIDRGVSHIITCEIGYMACTLCNTFGNTGHKAASNNGRICRACRDNMRFANPSTSRESQS